MPVAVHRADFWLSLMAFLLCLFMAVTPGIVL